MGIQFGFPLLIYNYVLDLKEYYMREKKAGLIPYYYDEKTKSYKYLFMVSSDPKFGGPRPMISKGTVEDGEELFIAAIREAQEELGFIKENTDGSYIRIYDEHVILRSGYEYDLTIFAVRISDRKMFDKPGFETKYTVWMTNESFSKKGRKDHAPIVNFLENHLCQN